MDFPLKKQFSFRPAGTALLALAMSGLAAVLLTGCTGQEVKVKDPSAALVSEPTMDQRLLAEDFGFPSQPPSLLHGRDLFKQQCAQCHASGFWQTQRVKEDLAYTTPIDLFLFLTTGNAPEVTLPSRERRNVLPAKHPVKFKDTLNRDDRWAVLFYTRYLAGGADIQAPSGAVGRTAFHSEVFGGNCAVCHGNSGKGDGFLYTGKTGNHELHDAPQLRNLNPKPANLAQYQRMYNRTDAQIFRYVCQGIYPSAMPSWYGNVDRDKDTGKVLFVFDDKVIWNTVRHVRGLSYNNDLPETEKAPPGLQYLQACPPVPNNRPWTPLMEANAPQKGAVKFPAGNPVTGGMILKSPHASRSGHHQASQETHEPASEPRSER